MFFADNSLKVLDKFHIIKEQQKALLNNVHSKQKRFTK